MTTSREHDAWLVDLDGTLYRPLPVKLAMAAELAVGGWSAVSVLRAFRKEHERVREGPPRGESPYRLQLERAAEHTGKDVAQVERLVTRWMFERPGRYLRRFRRDDLIHEIVCFRQAGGKTAVVSDYPATSKLRALGVTELFDVVVASGETEGHTALKPDPAGYLRAAAELAVAPDRALVIGDRPDADGEAAARAGMQFRRV